MLKVAGTVTCPALAGRNLAESSKHGMGHQNILWSGAGGAEPRYAGLVGQSRAAVVAGLGRLPVRQRDRDGLHRREMLDLPKLTGAK
jgi:hypothetical protein